MKTNYYILLILLLSFSFANAQSTEVSVEAVNTITVSEINDDVTVSVESTSTINKNVIIIDAAKVKERIARSSSDIRIFLNRERKVENIKLLFPKINKARTA
jgi:hypothetical protein